MRLSALCASVAMAIATISATPAAGHGGGLNAEGCHTNRRSGDYHCHRGPAVRAAAKPRLVAARTAFRNCSEARAAGAAPVRRGEPGYGSHLDRDDDGVGCE